MNHLSKKIFTLAVILAMLLAAVPLAVTPQAYPPGELKIYIADNWGKWGSSVPDPVTKGFGAVAYLYNSTKPVGWTGTWTFEDWILVKWGEADANGLITIPELPGDVWDRAAPGREINYTLIIKLKIGGVVTPITIYNATILRIGDNVGGYYYGTPMAVGLYKLIHRSLTNPPSYTYPKDPYDEHDIDRGWVQGIAPNFTKNNYAGFKVWMYYVAMQPLDELGFPITKATLEVFYNSSYSKLGNKTYIQNKKVAGWNKKPYGTWVTNGTREFVQDPTYIYHADYRVGWVVLRVPRINSTTGAGSSLVSNMTFIWRFKTGTVVNVTKYYVLEPTPTPGAPWLNLDPGPVPTVGKYSKYLGTLMANSTHQVNATVRWVPINLLDCYENHWFTMKAEVYAFDSADKNRFMLAGTRVGPGSYVLRYPVPVYPFGNTTLVLGVEWYYSTVNVSKWVVGYTWPSYSVYDKLYAKPWLKNRVGTLAPIKSWASVLPTKIKNNMTWVDVNFWSAAELPQQPADFAAKIWLPAGIAYRKAEPITVWWNGKGGFVMLPDMEFYGGPNHATIQELDPWGIARNKKHFEDFYLYMVSGWETYNFTGNGWLPTREVGWVDFEAYYEGVKVLDTYAEGLSLKLPCCEGSLPTGNKPPYTTCHYNFTLKIYELGFHIIFEACGKQMDAPTGVPFFFKHPNPINAELIGPKAITEGKVDIVKAPTGNYSSFAIVWHMSLLRPYKMLYLLDNGTTIELTEPINLTENMRNIQLYFKLWNLTVDTWSQDPFRIINVNVTLFSVSDFGLAPGIGITKRQLDQITDPSNIAYVHVIPPGWKIYKTEEDEYRYPVLYYYTDTQTNYATGHPSWTYLPEKDYWIWVRVPADAQKAKNAGFRAVDANATLYWSGDSWNKPLYLDECYGNTNPYIVNTYVYDPRMALKTACGDSLVFDDEMNSALILAEPWANGELFSMQQIDPSASVTIGGPSGPVSAAYNAYLIRKNATDTAGVIKLSSVNATSISPPNDPDLWNPTTAWVAKYYPNQSRYLIGYSEGGPINGTSPKHRSTPIKGTSPKYRFMVYYKGILVFNESMVLSNPYKDKTNAIKTSVYPYVFRALNDPLKGGTTFGIANIKVTVFWAGLNVTWWPTKHLAYETAPIEFSLLNASKLYKSFNMSVVKRLWGPKQLIMSILETIPYQPVPPYFSSMVVVESKLTDAKGKATFLIPVWNYSITPKIYTWLPTDGVGQNNPNLNNVTGGPRNPWNKALGPLSINLVKAGDANRTGSLFGTPVYANFTTVPGVTNNIPAGDVPRLVGVLYASKYARWIQHSMNATGLVNPATKVWEATRFKITYADGSSVYMDGVSVNTTYRNKNIYGGVGLLVGGAYQHRTPDSETGKTESPPTAECYAKAEERLPANDLGVVVRNLDKVGLPNQKVTVTREAIYVDNTKISDKVVLLEDWTPTKPNADPADYYILYLRSTPSNILWGIYDFTLRTENLTRGMTNTLLKLNDPQFLTMRLHGGKVDWPSGIYYLDWPSRLRVTILANTNKPLEKAWVYAVDAYTRGNVTAAITDEYGHAGTLFVGIGNAVPPLHIEPGDRVDIGFNLLRGWYWVDEDRILTGEAVNPDWSIWGKENPKQPTGDEYIQYIYYNKTETKGWARFYGKYYIIVYYKPAGCSAVLGPVMSEVVFDSYTDEPQHQYIYLGIWPEAYAPVSEYSAGQAKTFGPPYGAKVYDLRISFWDVMGRPLSNVAVTVTHPKYGWGSDLTAVLRKESNTVTLSNVPFTTGSSYTIHAEWTSRYGTKATVDTSVTETETSITMPVFDVTLKLVSRRGMALVGVPVKVANVDVGATSATGEVLVTQIPPGKYAVSASWLETALSLPSLDVTTHGSMTLMPTNMHTLTVRVIGAQGQALEGATVRVTKGTVEVTKLTDKDGKAEIELPDASYNIDVSYGAFSKTDSVSLTADTIRTLNLDVFIEFLGVGMSMAQFLLFIVMIVVIVIVLTIILHEYHIYRRKRLPQLFGAPTAPR
ncbi:MAG: carboxypeptidase regulatory-like domain-containing protein [Thermoproteota archaeon]